jgi:hypothetical protein
MRLLKLSTRVCLSVVRLPGILIVLLLACYQYPASASDDVENTFWNGPTYFQFHTGFASDTDFGPSLLFISDQSQERSYYQGISIGRQLGSSLYGYDVDVTGFFGLQRFRERGFQPDSLGVTLYWKIYRNWAPSWLSSYLPLRFGLGQGLSYVSRIPVAEQRDFEPDESAQTVHYLEWTVQVPISGLLRTIGVEFARGDNEWWIGYSIFHRSTVFGLFADSPGGINYPGITLEYKFNH